MKARKFTEKGLGEFRDFLAASRKTKVLPTMEFLHDDKYSTEIDITLPSIHAPKNLLKKSDLVQYLVGAEEISGEKFNLRCPYEMSWISAFLLENIIEKDAAGSCKIHSDVHYILDYKNARRRYRHRISSALQIFHEVPEIAHPIWFTRNSYVHGEMVEQSMGRLYMLRVPSVAGAIRKLYFNEKEQVLHPRIFSKVPRKGDLRNRFPVKVKQLLETYDIYSCDCDRLIELLGKEFKIN